MPVNPELFAAFLLATAILILIPGPVVTLVIANSLTHGTRTGIATVLGSSAGTAVLVAAGALGFSALLALMADIFEWVRWAGVAYLCWLGFTHWRAVFARNAPAVAELDAAPRRRGVFWQGFLVAVTNPKTIVFYIAFFPQFLDPALAAGPQLFAMSVGFVLLAILLDGSYALLAGRMRPLLSGGLAGGVRARVRSGITGTLLIGTGIGLALARRTSAS